MLVTGKVVKPRAFKNRSLPVIYKSQSSGWVTREVLTECFHESFEPSVKTFLKKENLPSKALLILDNAPGHPSEEELKSKDGGNVLTTKLHPTSTTNGSECYTVVKSHYKKSLIYSVISQNDYIIQCLKRINLGHNFYSRICMAKCIS
jgi:hypothetical protein